MSTTKVYVSYKTFKFLCSMNLDKKRMTCVHTYIHTYIHTYVCFAFVQGITDENDMNFLRTLSLIKGRDKCIYKPKVAFYSSEGVGWGGGGGHCTCA